MSIKRTLHFQSLTRRIEVYVEITRQEAQPGSMDTDLQPIDEAYNRLSVSVGSWERPTTRHKWREDSFGQCHDLLERYAASCGGQTRTDLQRLCVLWRQWHLNDMQAGTAAQKAVLDAAEPLDRSDWYLSACTALACADLLVDRGYKFGSRWLVKRVPAAVVAELAALCDRLEPEAVPA